MKKTQESDICPCKKGELEKIAETGQLWGENTWDGADQTKYFECNACKDIYERRDHISVQDTKGDYVLYNGSLTKKEIVKNAKNHLGDLTVYECTNKIWD